MLRRRLTYPVLAASLAVVLGGPALAQGERAQPPRESLRAIAPLDDPIYEVRQQAEQRLVETGWGTLGELHALLASGVLSPEQHVRVRRIAMIRFGSSPRAGMGVAFNGAVPNQVLIERVEDGFPASTVIRAGDRFVEADGVELENSRQLGVQILSHDPGDVMTARVERGEEMIDLDVPLGSYANLRQPSPNPRTLRAAYRARAERDEAPARGRTAALGSGVSLEDWTRAELGDEPPESMPPGAGSVRRRDTARESVVGGVVNAAPTNTDPRLASAGGGSASAWLTQRGEMIRRREIVEAQWERARAAGDTGEAMTLKRRLDKVEQAVDDLNRRLGQAE